MVMIMRMSTRQKFKMAFTFYSLLEACLLVVNAMAILHEERFLAKGMHKL